MINVLSIDVEECFHASEIGAPMSGWDLLPSRVEPQTRRVLDLLDRHSVKATFFVLGWIAQRHPALVREIAARGHELGCHSHTHRLVYDLTAAEFEKDTATAVRAIGDAAGMRPRLYRAPSYSITSRSLWALEVLAANGFTHDSSIYPITHDRYGIPHFGASARTVSTPSGSLLEVPIATVDVLGSRLPVGGGGYLRLLPFRYTAAGIRRLNARDGLPACVYFHPWELDPAQPRLGSRWISNLRTYAGLAGMEAKLEGLLREFRFSTLTAVHPAPTTTAAHC
jgi:polysaccharide deacetylase family protein (PEP-CTERM system associated)